MYVLYYSPGTASMAVHQTLLELGETGRAMQHFEEALRLQPDSIEARTLLDAARETAPATEQNHG